jgi:hypothetical protein
LSSQICVGQIQLEDPRGVAAPDQPLDSSVSHLKAVSQANLELVLVDIRKKQHKENKSSDHFLFVAWLQDFKLFPLVSL